MLREQLATFYAIVAFVPKPVFAQRKLHIRDVEFERSVANAIDDLFKVAEILCVRRDGHLGTHSTRFHYPSNLVAMAQRADSRMKR